ncbi:IS30 family transposase [Smaragdicoccus niigatensis]|uniref:IS30 family transposase n=6 Tax=Smaragdicoccus niigatensis TaxID=359359 RepID=UPI00351E849C
MKWAKEAGYQSAWARTASPEVHALFWRHVFSGDSVKQAAQAAGVSPWSGFRWVREAGGMNAVIHARRTACGPIPLEVAAADPIPLEVDQAPQPGHALTFTERWKIEQLLNKGEIPAEIARLLDRDRSTIGREIKRGAAANGKYRAEVGQIASSKGRARPKARKLLASPALLKEVVKRLKKRHSPEQVASRLRQDFPDEPEMWVSHETIYQAIYVQPRGELARIVKTALRSGRITRRPQTRADQAGKSGRLKDMVLISERPAEVEDRAVPGHWEGDLILGAGNKSAIGTLVERTTRFVLLLHLPGDHTSETVAAAMIAKMRELPEQLRLSLTWDQGREMALHAKITATIGMPIYFCDPHSPWQRGSNENTNGLLRQYFPKGTDLSFHGPGILDNVASELNGRPRKTLSWKTPAEALEQLLSNPTEPVAATA